MELISREKPASRYFIKGKLILKQCLKRKFPENWKKLAAAIWWDVTVLTAPCGIYCKFHLLALPMSRIFFWQTRRSNGPLLQNPDLWFFLTPRDFFYKFP